MPEYRTKINSIGNNTGIIVPDEVIEQLDAGKRPAVTVRVDDYEYRSTVARMKGTFMIPFSAEHREKSGFSGGDEVRITLEVDTEPRTVEVPDDLAKALAASPDAAKAYEALAPSRKKALVKAVIDAKKPETRTRRIARSVDKLEAGEA